MPERPASPLLLVARQELLLAARSRWVQIFAAVFALLSLGVAGSGYVLSGGHGFQDFARTSASLVELVALVVPLAALLMGVLALAPERGTAELLYAQPVARRTVLLGKLLGLFAALSAAQSVGFGAAGLVIFSQAGEEGGAGYALLVLGSILLTAAFLAIAALLAAGAVGRRRVRALALAIVVWFVAVVLLDVAALGAASLLPSGLASRVLDRLGDREPGRRGEDGRPTRDRGHRGLRRRLAGPPALHAGRGRRRGSARGVDRPVDRGARRAGGAPARASGSLTERSLRAPARRAVARRAGGGVAIPVPPRRGL